MIEIKLPWPPKELSPNARIHWAKLASIKKAYRCVSWAEAVKVLNSDDVRSKARERALLRLLFVPPDKRRRDWDNMLASMKAGLDGIADALGCDDRNFRLSMDVSDDVGGYVLVFLEDGA